MNTRAFNGLLLFLLLQTAATSTAETTRCTAITALPMSIEKQGSYCLIRSLNHPSDSDAAIIVNANNVSIDLNGYTLSGLAAGRATNAHGIFAFNRQNITIRNGTIRGFYRGIFLHDTSPSVNASQRHLIEGIRASRNTETGIYVKGSENIVRDNQVVDTGGSPFNSNGIYIWGSSARVINNDISRTSGTGGINPAGLRLRNSDGTVIRNNRIDKISSETGTTYAIRIVFSEDVLTTGNHVSSARVGIIYVDSSGKYTDNLTSNVETPFIGGTAVGINN